MNANVSQQTGTVLIAGLMILVIMTLISIATMNSSIMTEKLTRNLKDRTIAFQAAESALIDAEAWLTLQPTRPSATTLCTTTPCNVWAYGVQQNIETQNNSWWQTNARNFSSILYDTAASPQYFIQEEMFIAYELNPEAIAKGQGYQFYKIITKGTGSTLDSKAFVESIYAVSFN